MVDINLVSEDINEFQENERPPSEQLVELHLYLVPKEKWLEKRKLAKNHAVDHTISVGFVRVLPQTLLSELRKEMHRQLGIESVPQNYVFLRSVGRNFTQVRPKQEMEMKVKNYMPPFAPEPELFLKEGSYTGPHTWSQGEDSGLEESVGDTNSQRSHDRATPESLPDELPKLTDLLDVPIRLDLDERAHPGAMTVSMSVDDLTLHTGNIRRRKDIAGSSGDLDRSRDDLTRSNGWNRRPKRGGGGGTQLYTWTETRTTRLRRSKALSKSNNNNSSQQPQRIRRTTTKTDKSPSKPVSKIKGGFEAEDEAEEDDAGKVLMERIRVNSRCLKAQMSSRSRRSVADTGTPHKNSRVANGVYSMHAASRRNLRGGAGAYSDEGGGAEIENTTIKLLDEQGRDIDSDVPTEAPSSSEPEVTHQHTLAPDGLDGRTNRDVHKMPEPGSETDADNSSFKDRDSVLKTVTSDSDDNNNLEDGKLTIQVEVKEVGSSEDSSNTPETYDSYRVFSQQNEVESELAAKRAETTSRDEMVRLNRAKQSRGIYLRRMEHRSGQSNYDDPGSPFRTHNRSVSQSRKSGARQLDKWSTSAQSTGDLTQAAAWDYSNDKERLLAILSEVRGETRLRQRQREELLRKIKQLQSRAHQRREQVREMWRKRYMEAKKITPRLEEECSKLRQELEKLHRELLAKVQAGVWALLTISGKTERPSNKLSYKIMIARLLQEIEDLTRRVEATRLKLHTEVKLRSMAEKDVRNLREELLKKKIQVTLTRNQEQAALGNGLRRQYFISAV